jgi:hypothetical protein
MAILDPNFSGFAQPSWLRHLPHQWQPCTLDRARLHGEAGRLLSTDGFEAACKGFAENTLATYDKSQQALNKIMREAPRFALMAFVMYLHHHRGRGEPGVTYTRVKEIFALGSRSGVLATPTRIKAMFGLAKMAGQLRPAVAAAADKRVRVLEPTEKFIQPAEVWLRGCLEAVARAAPLIQSPAELIAKPGFLGEVMSYNVHAYMHDGFILYEELPPIQLMMSRENGYLTLMEILRSMRLVNGVWLARAPSVALAKRFAMARGTIRNLLAYGEHQGWLRAVSRGGHALTLSDEFANVCRRWVALEIVWTAGFANAAALRLDSKWDTTPV